MLSMSNKISQWKSPNFKTIKKVQQPRHGPIIFLFITANSDNGNYGKVPQNGAKTSTGPKAWPDRDCVVAKVSELNFCRLWWFAVILLSLSKEITAKSVSQNNLKDHLLLKCEMKLFFESSNFKINSESFVEFASHEQIRPDDILSHPFKCWAT